MCQRRMVFVLWAILGCAGFLVLQPSVCLAENEEPNTITCYFPPNYIKTTGGAPRSGWKIEYAFEPNFKNPATGAPQLLFIKHAEYLSSARGGRPVWIPIADDIRIAEIYVRYNSKNANTPDHEITELTKSADGLMDLKSVPSSPGTRPAKHSSSKAIESMEFIHLESGGRPYARAEYLYDDIRWMQGQYDLGIQYGHKLVMWSALYSENYRYLVRYVFYDDGTIELQVGATGHNMMDRAKDLAGLSLSSHVHLASWRMSLLLGKEPEKNQVGLFDYEQNGVGGSLQRKPIHVERAIDLQSERYQRLSVLGNFQNNQGSLHPVSYDVFPIGSGRLRLGKQNDHFAAHDIWITAEERPDPRARSAPDVLRLPDLINSPPEKLANRRFQVWCNASFIHIPRQEDFDVLGEQNEGVALTTWSRIRLHPRDISVSSPFY